MCICIVYIHMYRASLGWGRREPIQIVRKHLMFVAQEFVYILRRLHAYFNHLRHLTDTVARPRRVRVKLLTSEHHSIKKGAELTKLANFTTQSDLWSSYAQDASALKRSKILSAVRSCKVHLHQR